jgi:VanZ family protein
MPPRQGLRALWLALGWGWATTIVWLSLTPSPPTIDLEQGDKLGHLLGYGALMFWFCQLYPARRTRLAYALGFAALGVALEFAQGALGYRSYELFDMVANALGVSLGWASALLTGGRLLARLETAFSGPKG